MMSRSRASSPRRGPGRSVHAAFGVFGAVVVASASGQAVRVSVATGGAEGIGGTATWLNKVTINADGRHVFFASGASGLVTTAFASDSSPTQIYAHDRDPDGNGIYDEGNGVTTLMSIGIDGFPANDGGRPNGDALNGYSGIECSADGRFVVWSGASTNLVPGDLSGWAYLGFVFHRDTFVRDRDPDGNGTFDEGNGITTRITQARSGDEADWVDNTYDRFGITGDGRSIVFSSQANNIADLDASDNGRPSAFVHDRVSGFTARVDWPYDPTLGIDPNNGTRGVDISLDGRWIVYASSQGRLIPGDADLLGDGDILVYDAAMSLPPSIVRNVRVSVDDAGIEGDANSGMSDPGWQPRISGDGRFVTYFTQATNLDATRNPGIGLVVHDRDADGNGVFDEPGGIATRRISNPWNAPLDAAPGGGTWPDIDGTGARIVFESLAADLVSDDTSYGNSNIFVWERATGSVSLIDRTPAGDRGNGQSNYPAISEDGRWAAFISTASNLVPGDTNGRVDVFVVDLGAVPRACRPDLTGDGLLDLFDVLAYFDLYTAGDPGADWNADGVLDLFDIFGFVADYGAGC